MAHTWNVWSLSPDRKHWLAVGEEMSKKDAEEFATRTTATAARRGMSGVVYVALPRGRTPGVEHMPEEG